jgi:DNA-binding NarL/FixJ family response regulator
MIASMRHASVENPRRFNRPGQERVGGQRRGGQVPRTEAQDVNEDVHTEPLRVVLADDHFAYRQGLARLLRAQGIDVVADVSDGGAAVRAVQELAPDVVVMDLYMPGMSGLEATRRVTELAPASRVLVLSVSAREADVTEAILAGAMGYVLKDGPEEKIVAGIRSAAAGQSVISPRIGTILLQRVRDTPAAPEAPLAGAPLSTRELEVLRLLAEGHSNHEIADDLVISLGTVRTHISSILMKLHVENRVQAAVRAVRNHLV